MPNQSGRSDHDVAIQWAAPERCQHGPILAAVELLEVVLFLLGGLAVFVLRARGGGGVNRQRVIGGDESFSYYYLTMGNHAHITR